MNSEHALRVALVWNGTIYQERLFVCADEPTVTVGSAESNIFTLATRGLPETFEVFERTERGYLLRFTDQVAVDLRIRDEQYDSQELIDGDRVLPAGTVETADGEAAVYERELRGGDWGVVGLGRVNLFFQVSEQSEVIAGRSPSEVFDGFLSMALLFAFLLHLGFLLAAFLQPPALELDDLDYTCVLATFHVDDLEDVIEEEEEIVDEDGAVDDSSADDIEELAEFADEPDESADAELAEAPVDEEINIMEVGIHDALAGNEPGGALEGLFTDDMGDVEMAFLESGTEEIAGGRGTGDFGMIGPGGEGDVADLGGMNGIRSGSRGPGIDPGHGSSPRPFTPAPVEEAEVGDFCHPGHIQRVVAARANAIQHCFELELQVDPSLGGNMIVEWRIELDGSASRAQIAESTMNNHNVEACVVRVVERMRFNEPDGGMCQIRYPFVFTGLK